MGCSMEFKLLDGSLTTIIQSQVWCMIIRIRLTPIVPHFQSFLPLLLTYRSNDLLLALHLGYREWERKLSELHVKRFDDCRAIPLTF